MLGAFSSYTILQLYVSSFVQYKATRDLFLPGWNCESFIAAVRRDGSGTDLP
jgi:hypothetical protein